MIGAKPAPHRPLTGPLALYRTSIGKKAAMAVTGLILDAYVIVHMLANLKIFQGADSINAYALFLREVGAPVFSHEQLLWIARVVLLGAVLLHITSAVQLTRMDLAGRPVGYARQKAVAASYASRTMRWGGAFIALFIIYHLLHMTTGSVHPSFVQGDVYHNLVAGFRVWYVSAFYVAAMVALGLHLYHGMWSMFQTLGWNSCRFTRFWRGLATITAIVVAVGFASVPVAVLAGLVK